MKFALLLLFASAAHAATLESVEVRCWNGAVDSDGSFLCQYVMVLGKPAGSYEVPYLGAPDGEEGPRTFEQANRACLAMGFSYALRVELAQPTKPELQLLLDPGLQTGDLFTSEKPFIQHLNCL